MRIDGFGGMPFAVVAVALLLMSASLVAVVDRYGESADDAEGALDGIEDTDIALADMQAHINLGLGGIVRGLSVAEEVSAGDTVEMRAEAFVQKASEWLESQFPLRSGQVRGELLSHTVGLTAEPMSLESSESGYTPTYLRGTGTVHVRVTTEDGSGEADIEVSTDGSYALPLSAERLSIMGSMTGDGGVSVSQMMAYQLACLAQYRVMDGYGAISAYGERGTSSILTAEDVANAYRNSLEAVVAIALRDGDMAILDMADLSDLLASEDGTISLDLDAVYAQALLSVLDDLALRWFDYFLGFEVLDVLIDVLMPFREAVSALSAFLEGDGAYSAVPYIEETMGLAGVDAVVYRHPGSGTTTVSAAGITVTVDNPVGDVLSAGWLNDFERRYEKDTNFVMDYILDVLRGAAASLFDGEAGTVSAEVDPYDDVAFDETLAELFETAMGGSDDVIEASVTLSLDSTPVSDPFYGAIADEVMSHSDEFVLSSQLESAIVSEFSAAIPPDSGITVDILYSSGAMDRALHSYRSEVMSDLSTYDVMRDVADGRGIVKTALSLICAVGLDVLGLDGSVTGAAERMCAEMLGVIGMNPHGGVTDLPGSDVFRLDDGTGSIAVESLDSELTGDLIVEDVSVDRGRCVHTVGFRENLSAAYSTVFVIEASDLLDIRVVGSGAMSEAMGTCSSVLEDTVPVDLSIEVTVCSGWALDGIEYIPSDNFYEDLWNAVLEVLEPIIEPLRNVMEAVRGAVTVLSESLVEALSFVAGQLARVYHVLMEPMESLKRWLEGAVEKVFTEAALDVLVSIGMDEQAVTLQFFGCVLEISTDMATWAANTRTLFSATLTMPVAGLTVVAGITAKVRGELEAENLVITGHGGVSGDGWSLDMKLDPLMRGSKYLINLDAEIGDTDISLMAPKLESYYEMGIALSDVPGLGSILDNIPLPGARMGIDAGFSLKYSDPMDNGLIVNEFEANPAGEDRGHEWVELLNNGITPVDLDGYTMLAASDRRTKVMELSGTLSPGEFLVIYPDFTLVNSSGKYTKNGEAIVLKDPDGNEVDRTPTKKDGANDGMTWQRSFDGSTEWVLAEATQGRTNSLYPGSSLVSASELRGSVWTAVERSFDRVGTITDLESLQTFLKHLVRYTLEELIGVVAGRIVEASVYVSVDISDLSSSASAGARISIRTDGDLAEDVLRYAVGKLMEMVLKADNPYSIDPLGMFTENIDLEVTAHAGVGFPELLSEGADLPRLDIGTTFRTNLAGITALIGKDTGRPGIVMGLRVIDCPDAAIPSRLSARDGMDHDLWLMMVTVKFA